MKRSLSLRKNLLETLRNLILERLDPELLKNGTWVHHQTLLEYRLASLGNHKWSYKRSLEVLHLSIPLLQLMARNPSRTSEWKNILACPKSPIGGYIWSFQADLIQELIWQRQEFVEGYDFGSNPEKNDPDEKMRDGNPYSDFCRSQSWDVGYILGIRTRHQPEDIHNWIQWLETEVEPLYKESYLGKMLKAAQECTGEQVPGNWEWKGREHSARTCKCFKKPKTSLRKKTTLDLQTA